MFFSQLSFFPGLGAGAIDLSPWAHWAGDVMPWVFHGVLDVLSIVHLELDRGEGVSELVGHRHTGPG